MHGVYGRCVSGVLKAGVLFLYFHNKENIQRQLKHHNSGLDKKTNAFVGNSQ